MNGFAYAQAGSSGMEALNSLLIPTILIIGIMYFLMIRPQQKRMKEHQQMVESVRRGDAIVTNGGIIGKVTKVLDNNEVQVEVAEGVRIRVQKQAIGEVRSKGEPAKEDAKK